VEKIAHDTQRDFWLDTTMAKDYGLLGYVISSQDELDRMDEG
jgi:ATP-dependent protease ClpP protease subunit